ncbi:ras guanine nucleotide exchange factor i-related [Anaeramoeba flamelloides]|uniref:Ras guanine nucleotide exchange factor i-related n=1 Tax=Anaeramoeba flamelloides TaxID=1746091 RepID=A0ABQ8X5H7_9EUKA|nr:ras guanine nucleotide exchange factor i-related [Anaeramoeba flamelloides]
MIQKETQMNSSQKMDQGNDPKNKTIEKKIEEKPISQMNEPRYLRDSRLQNLIRTAIKNVDFVWDQTINDYHNQINENGAGISLVDHFHSLGIEEKEDDIDELNSIWDDDDQNNIIYTENKENEIEAASLNKLVEMLTHEKKRNVLYTKTFLMTYQSFTTPRKLLAKLIQRFHIPPEKEEIYKGRKKIIRLRVCNFLRFWITDYFEDFQPKLLPELIDFIDNSIRTADMTKMANNLKEIIERNLNGNDEQKENSNVEMPEPKLPKNVFSPKLSLFDVDEEEIARQLTLIEFKIYSKIKPSELLKLAWSKPKLRHKSPNVLKMIKRFNMVSIWVIAIILKSEKLKKRKKILTKLVKIATFLRKHDNFNCVMTILSGLASPPINRLKYTFEELPTKSTTDLDKLGKELSSENSYEKYRKKIKQASPPCIPYFALYLTDLTSVEEGNKDEIQGLINFGKRKLIYDLISEIQKFQKSPYNFQSIHQIETLLLKLPHIDQQESYTRSLKLEPRGSKKDKIH